MRVGILELLAGAPTGGWTQAIGRYLTTRQYASAMPQVIAVWCRQLGHKVSYATYYGQDEPKRLLPNDLDVVFIACHTHASALAYALAKLYRSERTLTVVGGPHAKSFPHDCLRFFDWIVLQCDKTVIADILGHNFDPGSIVSSGRPLNDLPSVEERLPDIKSSAFLRRKTSYVSTIVPMLASVGCPYTCDFCTDWNSPYRLLPLDRLEADLRYLAQHLSTVKIGFHDPNFAIEFDRVLDVLEKGHPGKRNPYVMESSLSGLRGSRLQRLRDTHCIYVAPGIESWSSYSGKVGEGGKTGSQKLHAVVEHIQLLHTYVPGMQANFMFGLDTDEGNEPVELTKEFMSRTPFAWPAVNIPVPFGGTPFFEQSLREGRILTSMPLSFYFAPYLVTTLKHYDPVTYYQKLIEMAIYSSTRKMLWHRLRTTPSCTLRLLHTMRTLGIRGRIRKFQQIVEMMTSDSRFRAFHEGRSTVLPEFYHQEYERMLGPYASLLSRADRMPVLVPRD